MANTLSALLGAGVGLCWRVVETQEVAATRSITRSAQEQNRLEILLDASKPKIPPDCAHLSYLLATPFRYPPLAYGSRFGSTMERGVFYGSTELATAFAETAVYLWLFRSGPISTGALASIRDQRTAFSVSLASQRTADLHDAYFDEHSQRIRDPASWQFTQELGRALRASDAECIWYPSARWPPGKNIAVFSPSAFATQKPQQQMHWQLHLDNTTCWFGHPEHESMEFKKSDFTRDGRIPHPAL